MGSDPSRDADAYDREQPQHNVDLPYEYYMARYPVTVAQFEAFVQASGYKPGNEDWGRDYQIIRWYMSWHDALAYCEWLTARLREGRDTRTAGAFTARCWLVCHATQRGRVKEQRGADGRRYPWGDDSDPNRANYDETGIGKTSAVGCFPGGVSPHGVEEMSGNVWEWTRSLWGAEGTN